MAVLPKTLTTSVAFTDPQNVKLANGYLTLDLSAPAVVYPSSGQIVPTRVDVQLDANGLVLGTPAIWGNDQLNPTNTLYLASIYNSNGLLVSGPLYWSLTGGSPINLSAVTPVSLSTLSFSLPGLNQLNLTSSGTFTIPASVTKVKATIVGGGGAGGGGTNTNGGSGGGSGACTIKYFAGLTPGNTITVTIGLGGTGVSGTTGNNGANTTLTSGTQTISTVQANGGSGGFAAFGVSGQGGAGGTAGATGDINLAGNSAHSITNTIQSGAGAGSILAGGATASAATGTGNGGNAPGAGGAGSLGGAAGAGGSGANGIAIFEWVL